MGLFLARRRGLLFALPAELVHDGNFLTFAPWTLGTGWSQGSGVVTHAAGTAANVTQSVPRLVAGGVYTAKMTVSGRTAGSVQLKFMGGTTVAGTLRSTNASFSESMTAVAGNNIVAISCTATFVGSCTGISIQRIG